MEASELRSGMIVIVDLADPQDRNRKERPVLVLSDAEDVSEDEIVQGVAITGAVDQVPPGYRVELPYSSSARSRARTGLRKRSVAACNWIVEFDVKDILRKIGDAPPAALLRVYEIINAEAGEGREDG
jgi:mRNA-degrading endonuclease toxin of MazEF toxin-antitoxin module